MSTATSLSLLVTSPFLFALAILPEQTSLCHLPQYTYNGTPSYTGPARSPDGTELGWKETVRMNPSEVTTVIMRFTLPKVPFIVPPSPRTGGNEYVWHCHILEHEEHDMMRPLVVI
jgi:hypothetical protein